MNIFNKVALHGLKKNRIQTLVTVIGVILSTVMITAVASFGTSLLHYLVQGSIAKYGNWHAEYEGVKDSFVQKQKKNAMVSKVTTFENQGYALLQGAKSKEKPYVFLAGFQENTAKSLPITMIVGRMPKNDTEVVIPSHIAVKAGVSIQMGDKLTLAVGKRELGGKVLTQNDSYQQGETITATKSKTYTVVGICERPTWEEHNAPGYTLITKSGKTEGHADFSLFITLKNPRKVNDYVAEVSKPFGGKKAVLNEDVLRFMGVSGNKIFNTLLYSVGGVLVAIIMIGSVFLIYNSFHISLNERMHQFGILMSVGATEKQLRNSVLFEGLCIGGMGIPIGILLGIGSVDLLLPMVANNFSTFFSSSKKLTLFVSVPVLLAAAVISMITILISAYLPARKAAAVPVMECIRQSNEIKAEGKEVKVSKLAQKIYGLEGILALKNFKRNKKRYRSIVFSLTLSVVLFVAGNTFGTTLKQLAKMYVTEADGDLVFDAKGMEENKLMTLYKKLKNTEGVYRTVYQSVNTYKSKTTDLSKSFAKMYKQSIGKKTTVTTENDQALQMPLDIQFLEDSVYYNFIKKQGFSLDDYKGKNAKVLSLVVNTAEHKTYFKGDAVNYTILSPSGEKKKMICSTVVDSYPIDLLSKGKMPKYYFMVVAPWSMHSQFVGLETSKQTGITFWSKNPTKSMAKIQGMLAGESISSNYTVSNLSQAVELFRSITFVVDIFTYVFIIMLTLIAVANVFNTIFTGIRLRRKELAMLRSVGMSERSFGRMMNFECMFYGAWTLFFGIPISGLLSWLIYKMLMMAEQTDVCAFVFPWQSIVISTLGVFVIVFVTMLYATDRIKKENIIDAMREETT